MQRAKGDRLVHARVLPVCDNKNTKGLRYRLYQKVGKAGSPVVLTLQFQHVRSVSELVSNH